MIASGGTDTTEEATVHVYDLNMFCSSSIIERITAVLWLKKCTNKNGSLHEWHPDQPSNLINNGRNVECTTDKRIPLDVPGV